MRTGPGWRDRRGMQPDTAGALGGGKQPTRILIVDDHEISRAALRALLRTEGIDVADVRTDGAAITVMIAFHPDMAFVDMTLAGPAGFIIACRLRALPHVPALVLTSSASRRGSTPSSAVTPSSPRQARALARRQARRSTSRDGRACNGRSLSARTNERNNDATDPGQDQAPPAAHDNGRSAHGQQQDSADMVSRLTAAGDTQIRWLTREGVLDELDLASYRMLAQAERH